MNLFGSISAGGGWRRPEVVLLLMAAASAMSFAVWMVLLNNFAIERASFTGAEMGILQSIREIPGFLSFAVVFLLLLVREQALALLSLAVLGIGIALTGFFPTIIGLYLTTVIMSLGYHYFETVQASLSLQWIPKEDAPQTLGRIIAANSFAGLAAFGLVYAAFDFAGFDFKWVYLLGGGITVAMVLLVWLAFPRFPQAVEQRKHMVLRRRYWLYYLLTFMAGARRQIFMVFAGFLMVEKFGYSVEQITALFLLNGVINVFLAPRIGRLIGRWGERRALTVEYIGLIVVFTAYAFVENATVAAGLYVIDHMFFAMAIAIKTYFQKIADPADIAPTAGVGFTINHTAAVVIPAAFGFLWLISPAAVFLAGSAMAAGSLFLARLIPPAPAPGNESVFPRAGAVAAAE
jgi:predicted MFS family arabinose efflux permease